MMPLQHARSPAHRRVAGRGEVAAGRVELLFAFTMKKWNRHRCRYFRFRELLRHLAAGFFHALDAHATAGAVSGRRECGRGAIDRAGAGAIIQR